MKVKRKKEQTFDVVFWDGSFRAAGLLSDILRGIPYSTNGGNLTYFKDGKMVDVLRSSYVLKDGDEIKTYCQSGDSLLENDYDIIEK